MPQRRLAQVKLVVLGVVAVVAVFGASVLLIPSLRETLRLSWLEASAGATETQDREESARLIYRDGKPGLRLTQEAVDGLGIDAKPAQRAIQARPLPPQIGTVNYDNEGLFSVRSRFSGELVEVAEREEPGPSGTPKKRPLRYGDKVKQGELLAVVYSKDLGAQKAALVDAVSGLRLSQENLTRYEGLFADGALSLAQYKNAERQVQADSNALLTAERMLLMWKLTKEEIQAIKDEANIIHDQKLVRSADAEAKKWGRCEIRVPRYCDDPKRELVIVEKNTNLNDMVDPSNSLALFRVADMTRLQIWVHPPEEYLPVLRKMLESLDAGPPNWQIKFQSSPAGTPPLDLQFVQIAPSLEPFQHTPMLIGYLPNNSLDGTRYVVGQFVTATIMLSPARENTMEIPTAALNEVGGQSLVFVQPKAGENDFILRRVVVVHRFKDKTFVRMKLTEQEEKQNALEIKNGKRPLEPLLDGDRVVTQGVIELTAALEDLLTKEGRSK